MDQSASREEDVCFDLESGINDIHIKDGIPDPSLDEKPAKTTFLNPSNINESSIENNVSSIRKEKGKKGSSSAKKPPRPPRGFSLDAYDQNLIKEIAKLAMIKRARIERMKALKLKKASKISSSSSSSSSSSHATLFAMLFTIIFFLVILLQGRNSGVTFHGSPQMAQKNENGSIFIQDHVPYV